MKLSVFLIPILILLTQPGWKDYIGTYANHALLCDIDVIVLAHDEVYAEHKYLEEKRYRWSYQSWRQGSWYTRNLKVEVKLNLLKRGLEKAFYYMFIEPKAKYHYGILSLPNAAIIENDRNPTISTSLNEHDTINFDCNSTVDFKSKNLSSSEDIFYSINNQASIVIFDPGNYNNLLAKDNPQGAERDNTRRTSLLEEDSSTSISAGIMNVNLLSEFPPIT